MSLPTPYQNYVHLSKYARWLNDEGRREYWPETVQRYFDFFVPYLGEKHDLKIDFASVEWLKMMIEDLHAMPSMRALVTAGPALARDHVCAYNPVSGSTEVLTREHGVVPIRDLSGASATVLNKDGRWAEADFRCYGEQPLREVRLKLNSNTERSVECTGNHRWVLSDGSVLPTDALRSGDRIDFVAAPRPNLDDDYRLGVVHGLIYGDGTAVRSSGRVRGYRIRLCSDAEDLLPWFNGYPVCHPPSFGGDPVVMMYDGFAQSHALKELPRDDETESYLLGFMRGWLAADGYVSKASQVSICVKESDRQWIRRVAPRVGFVVQREALQARSTNYGERNGDNYIVFFSRSSCVEDDFLIQRKRDRFCPLDSHYVVSEVRDTGRSDLVYCAEVPDTNTFTLAGGLVTGNCAYVAIDDPRVFSEILFILACTAGVGFSVERQYVNKLPVVPEHLDDSDTTITVRDSKRGWAEALNELIGLLYAGRIPRWDMTKVRPAGTVLKTMGGRASGPEPLVELFEFIVRTFMDARGRRLTSQECHDIACKIGDAIIVGGVRRSALISFSNLSDQRMRDAKSGQWWELHPHRALANNSVAYTERPEVGQWMAEWLSLYESKSGERGVFNREAATKKAESIERRAYWDQEREHAVEFGGNPCMEIFLRSQQFCNLSSAVAREDDTIDDLENKVTAAAIFGTWQSCLTDFRYLRKRWRDNVEEERLLGVSLSGIQDCQLLNLDAWDQDPAGVTELLEHLRDVARGTNAEWAERLGIPAAAAVTCVKPEGNSSQLVDSSSGMHARYARRYIRRVRQDNMDPLTRFMIEAGFPHEPDVMKPHHQTVFSFPVEAPETAVLDDSYGAIDKLEHWRAFNEHWCDHNPSTTIQVSENEWPSVGAWVWDNFDYVGGLSFLPRTGHTYRQAPYEAVSEEALAALREQMPTYVDWSGLSEMEAEDHTNAAREMACVGNQCEL